MAAQFPPQQTEPLFFPLTLIFMHHVSNVIMLYVEKNPHQIIFMHVLCCLVHIGNIYLSIHHHEETKEFVAQDGCRPAVVIQLIDIVNVSQSILQRISMLYD